MGCTCLLLYTLPGSTLRQLLLGNAGIQLQYSHLLHVLDIRRHVQGLCFIWNLVSGIRSALEKQFQCQGLGMLWTLVRTIVTVLSQLWASVIVVPQVDFLREEVGCTSLIAIHPRVLAEN